MVLQFKKMILNLILKCFLLIQSVYYFILVYDCFACVYTVNHLYAWCLRMPEEGSDPLELELQQLWEASALNPGAVALAPTPLLVFMCWLCICDFAKWFISMAVLWIN